MSGPRLHLALCCLTSWMETDKGLVIASDDKTGPGQNGFNMGITKLYISVTRVPWHKKLDITISEQLTERRSGHSVCLRLHASLLSEELLRT